MRCKKIISLAGILAIALLSAAVFVEIAHCSSAALTVQKLWENVERAERNGLPQTAIESLDELLKISFEGKDYNVWMKALSKKIVFEGTVQGNRPEEKVNRMKEVIKDAPQETRPLLQAVLARWYWHFFLSNRWRFEKRAQTAGLDDDDITSWDLNKILYEVDSLYTEILSEKPALSKIPTQTFESFLEPGNSSRLLRPTLYDFLVAEAVEFYVQADNYMVAPQDAFQINFNSPASGPLEEFLRYAPQTADFGSFKYKAVRLYQELLRLHQEDGNLPALADAELARIIFIKNNSYGDNKEDVFLERLREILSLSENEDVNSFVYYHKARIWGEKGDLVTAVEKAQSGFRLSQDTRGGRSCKNYTDQITARLFSIETEHLIPEKKQGQLKIQYKNIDKIYVRVVSDRWDHFQPNSRPYSSSQNQLRGVLARQPAYRWHIDLEQTPDYQEIEFISPMPEIKPGFYWIFASLDENFNDFAHSWFWVSSLGIVSRSEKWAAAGFVLDNVTGEPIPGADVLLYQWERDGGYQVHKTGKTDKDGYFDLKADRERYFNSFIRVSTETQDLLDISSISLHEGYRDPERRKRVVLLTDRSLYRPGQVIYFKGILADVDQLNDEYKVIPDEEVEVRFLDANRQEIERLKFVTNDFGSFSGSFTAPVDGLSGVMSIETVSPRQSIVVRVEEYKRPRFEVQFDVPEDEIRVGEKVFVSGAALSYSGAPINEAMVTFRVSRQARFPFCGWWCRPRSARPSAEIANGKVFTDEQGRFTIEFEAAPDKSLPEKDNPVFHYVVSASVTDNTGETRTGNFTVRAGYISLELLTQTQAAHNQGEDVRIEISGRTLNGKDALAQGDVIVYQLQEPQQPVPAGMTTGFVKEISPGFDENWRSWPVDKQILTRSFVSEAGSPAVFSLSDLSPGFYRVEAKARDKFGSETESMASFMVLPDRNAKRFTLKLPSYVNSVNATVEAGQDLDLLWATGYETGRAFIEIEHKGKFLKRYWTSKGQTQHRLIFPVTKDLIGGFNVFITYVRDNRFYNQVVYVDVPYSDKDLQLSFRSFRDRLEPGQKEHWSINIKGRTAPLKAAELAAVLYDSSLDAFYPHRWPNLNVFRRHHVWLNQRYSNSLSRFSGYSGDRYQGHPLTQTYWSFPDEIIQLIHHYGWGRSEMEMDGMPMMVRSLAYDDNAVLSEQKSEQYEPYYLDQAYSKDQEPEKEESFDDVPIRENLDETAFFYPHLIMEEDGSVSFEFAMPEALTKWRFMGLAHGKELQSGFIEGYTVTQKDLMVEPNPPRFLREGDEVELTAKISNLSKEDMDIAVQITFTDMITGKDAGEQILLEDRQKTITVNAGLSQVVFWKVRVPKGLGPLRYVIAAKSGQYSDGEAGVIPVVSSRIFLTESQPLWISGAGENSFTFQRLKKLGESSTLEPFRFTVEMTSNPSWYVIQALPYLIEFPYECSEQVFNRYYANVLAAHVANSDPQIRRLFDLWKERYPDQLVSELQKNEELKNTLLKETPWVRDAQDETAQRHRIGLLFEKNNLEVGMRQAVEKLRKQQLFDGSWPWFPGGRGDDFITLYITAGFGRLKHLDVAQPPDFALKAVDYLDGWIKRRYDELVNKEKNHLNPMIAMYLYARSFFLDVKEIPAASRIAVNYYLDQSVKYWLSLNSRMSQGHLALALHRFGDKVTSQKIMRSILERSVTDPEMGRFWREDELSLWWHEAPIETQALMIEAFDEITGNELVVDECRLWLLKQKQTRNWKTTKATADAVYALIVQGADYLSGKEVVQLKLGGRIIDPKDVVPGPNYYKKSYQPDEITGDFSAITVIKKDDGPAWGGAYFQYFEEVSEVEAHKTSLSLEKSLWVEKDTKSGPMIEEVKDAVKVGDRLIMRIVLRTDRDLEYVHLKDHRGSGTEPENVLSMYKYQDGLRYYEATGDISTDFFISYLPKGTYVFQYPVRIQHRGEYQSGIATIQCMYAPEFTSHSRSIKIKAE